MKRKLKFHLTSYQDMRELSMKTFSYISIFILCLSVVDGNVSLNYSEVEKFGNSCPRLDSCTYQRSTGRRQLVSVKESNCACDYLCSEYGDCCIDAPGIEMDFTATRNILKCFELKQFGGVYMKDFCPPSYEGPEDVKLLCESTKLGDQTDPLGSMPVTDSLTGLTYKNYYCSMCNDKTDNIVLWTPRLECPLLTLFNGSKNITNDYVFQNLATDGQNWGLFLDGENGSLFFHDCDIDPVMPMVLESKIRLCKPNLVSECSPSWEDDDVQMMCQSYMGAKYVHGGDGYKNIHCAICNNVNVTHLSCQSAELRGIDIFRQFGTHSFALLLDINEKRGQEVGKIQMCENGEVFDPFFKKCRSLTCLPGFVRRGRNCFLPEGAKLPKPPTSTDKPLISILTEFSENNASNVTYERTDDVIIPDLILSSGKSYNVSNVSDISTNAVGKFLNCLLISLGDEDFVMLPNQTIFVPKYDKLYEPTSYFAADGSILVCTHFTSEHDTKFLPLLGYVTIVGLGISMLFLVLHFVAFCIVPDLRNLSGKNLMSQCFALFCAYFCFISGQFDSLSVGSCSLVAFLTFYFFQVSFFWMAVMAYDVWRTLKMATTELRVSSGKQIKRFVAYSFFTWVTPLFILMILALAQYTDKFPPAYRPGFMRAPCWFKQRRSLLVFFATPLFAIMLANVILFIASARMIVMTGNTSIVSQQSKLQRRNFKLYLRLALLMGFTWVVGLVAGYADWPFLFYVFVILNTLQGLFIFLAFSCSSKVRGYLKNKFKLTSRTKEFKSSSASASSASAFSTKPTTLMIRK